MARLHADGDPDGCSESCRGPHYEDEASEVCPNCGGNGRACFYGCDRNGRPYELFEGSTGAEEYGFTAGQLSFRF